jgi:hypothetical protein
MVQIRRFGDCRSTAELAQEVQQTLSAMKDGGAHFTTTLADTLDAFNHVITQDSLVLNAGGKVEGLVLAMVAGRLPTPCAPPQALSRARIRNVVRAAHAMCTVPAWCATSAAHCACDAGCSPAPTPSVAFAGVTVVVVIVFVA